MPARTSPQVALALARNKLSDLASRLEDAEAKAKTEKKVAEEAKAAAKKARKQHKHARKAAKAARKTVKELRRELKKTTVLVSTLSGRLAAATKGRKRGQGKPVAPDGVANTTVATTPPAVPVSVLDAPARKSARRAVAAARSETAPVAP